MAYARTIALDLYGGNVRLANQFNPATMTADGLLPRWEKILNCPPNYGDSEPVRRGRVAASFARFAQPNSVQPVIDACSVALGPLYVGLALQTLSSALIWWPSLGGGTPGGPDYPLHGPCSIASASGVMMTVAGLSNVPTAAPGATLTLSNCTAPTNNGAWTVHDYVSSSSVKVPNIVGAVAPDYGVGGTSGSPTISWSLNNPVTPWMSTIAHVGVRVTAAVTGYQNTDGSPNGAFFGAVGGMRSLLDELLPAWATFSWWISSSHGGLGFYFDEPNIGLEAFR